VVVVGLYGGAINLPTPFLPMRALTLRGSYVGSHADMAELLALVNDKGMPAVPIATRPLDEVSDALADLRAGRVVGRVVLAG
jgi:D-arabinose 1-dehydrogenase-like Zn-dependent alcohol dehydrogenase